MSKPWETPPAKTQPWPTDAEAAKAMQPPASPTNSVGRATPRAPEVGVRVESSEQNPVPMKIQATGLESDLIQIMGTLNENECENVVVIGISDDGRVLSMRRQSPNGVNAYALIGALEAFKDMIIQHELRQEAAKVKK